MLSPTAPMLPIETVNWQAFLPIYPFQFYGQGYLSCVRNNMKIDRSLTQTRRSVVRTARRSWPIPWINVNRRGKTMNDPMTIYRSGEEGMYLLREGKYLWRVNEDGMVDCIARGHTRAFDLLTSLQQWKTPSRRLLQEYSWEDPLMNNHNITNIRS